MYAETECAALAAELSGADKVIANLKQENQGESLVAAIEGNLEGMAKSDLILTCKMLENGRAIWRKEAEAATAELATLRTQLAAATERLVKADAVAMAAKAIWNCSASFTDEGKEEARVVTTRILVNAFCDAIAAYERKEGKS